MKGRAERKRGYVVVAGKITPWWKNPFMRLAQDRAMLKTPGLVMRVPQSESTLLVFDAAEDADNCLMHLIWTGNPHGDYVHEAEYSDTEEKVWVYGPVDGFPGEGS